MPIRYQAKFMPETGLETPTDLGGVWPKAGQARLHAGAVGELVVHAAPILDPPQLHSVAGVIGHLHTRDERRIVAKRSQDSLIDFKVAPFDCLSVIPFSEDPLEALAVSGIIGAQNGLAIGEEADTGAIQTVFGLEVVQKLRSTFILPHLHVSVV